MNQLPIELHHTICAYLNFDNSKDYQNVFNIKLDYETLFSIGYHELYPSMKKIFDNIKWKLIYRDFENINYYGSLYIGYEFLEEHLSIDQIDIVINLIYDSLIIIKYPNFHKYTIQLLEKGMKECSKFMYDILSLDNIQYTMFYSKDLKDKYEFLKFLCSDIRRLSRMVLIFIDELNIDKIYLIEIINKLKHYIAKNSPLCFYNEAEDREVLKLLKNELIKMI